MHAHHCGDTLFLATSATSFIIYASNSGGQAEKLELCTLSKKEVT
jgi:hypothetical protein